MATSQQRHIRLVPVSTEPGASYPLDSRFIEFPWEAQFASILHGATRRMLAIYDDSGELVGAMTVDHSGERPELVFFEVVKAKRGKGIGKAALLAYIESLRAKGHKELFIQTGRPVIYKRMGFHFTPVARSGLIIDLERPLIENRIPDDVPMVLVHTEEYLWHETYDQPERPCRLSVTIEHLRESGLLDLLAVVPPRYAAIEEVARIHRPDYIEQVRRVSAQGGKLDTNCWTCRETFDVALLSFGGALLAGEYIEDWRRAFVLCRPPGHHALPDRAMGFCFFNNMAGLALMLRERGYSPLVIDWDVHHGNGTQEILYDIPLPFISIHQRDLFPGTGLPTERGAGPGLGHTYNFPVPPLCTDAQYLEVFSRVEELADRYRPDILLISAGQDGHREEKLSGTMLSTACYGQMAATVRRLADRYCEGRIILLLEGGYNLERLGEINEVIIREIAGI